MRPISPQEHQQLQNEFLAVLGTAPNNSLIDDRHRLPENAFEASREHHPGKRRGITRDLGESACKVAVFFAVLFGSAFTCIFVLVLPYIAVLSLYEDAVRLPENGQSLALTGVPGEEIKLHIFEAASDPDQGRSSAYLQVTDAESGFQTTLPARFEAGQPEDDGDRPVFARLVVPGETGKQTPNLTGVLWGEVVFENGESRSLEVPLSLGVVQSGQGETSGHRDKAGADRAFLIFFLLGCLATCVMTSLVYADWAEKRSESWIARLSQST